MSEPKNKCCPKCGSQFHCQGEDCWCEQYHILPKDLHYIRATWNDCLCPQCLKAFAENKEEFKNI
jgi:hypothetical protein